MKFTLDLALEAGDSTFDAATLLSSLDAHRAAIGDIALAEGRVVLQFDGKEPCAPYADPLVRLVDQWLRKLIWVIGGDTETVALRNSEQCFAFVAAAGSVEVSYFNGTESEVEDYLVEPNIVKLDVFVNEVLRLGERLVALVRAIDAEALQAQEVCRDLVGSLDEAKRAWHDYQLHQRR